MQTTIEQQPGCARARREALEDEREQVKFSIDAMQSILSSRRYMLNEVQRHHYKRNLQQLVTQLNAIERELALLEPNSIPPKQSKPRNRPKKQPHHA